MMEKMDGMSMDLVKENIDILKALFPSVVTEGKIDFEMLQSLLGKEINSEKEKYQFTWNGKTESIKVAQAPSSATLRPCKEISTNWEGTENLYIEGDNLEVLKQLQKTYFGKIKVIYIDPPYNTGNDFVYKDDYKDSIKGYLEQTNQVQSSNPETNGRYHSDWLNMMYPRLILSRNLLSDDGVIFISISDDEQANLKKICDEIFGDTNFISVFKWNRVKKAPSLSNSVRTKYEYILAYSKNGTVYLYGKDSYNKQGPLWHLPNKKQELLFPAKSIRVKKDYIKGNYGGTYLVDLLDDIVCEDGLNKDPVRIAACSAWGQEKINQYVAAGNTFEIKKEPTTVYTDLNSKDNFIAPSDLINDEECGVKCNTDANDAMKRMGIPFDYTKPVSLIRYLIKMVTHDSSDAIVMDFFSGSATTAHAVMELNAYEGKRLKYVMVQLPEAVPDGSDAQREGYHNLCEIGEERIRRASQELLKEGLLTTDIDTGFKVFKLDSTNINPWDNKNEYDEDSLFTTATVFKLDRSKEDVLYEIMLKYGVFDQSASEVEVNGKTMYRVGQRHMIVCLEDKIDDNDISEICKLEPRVVVFKEDGFKDDNAKINAEYNLKKSGVEDVKAI